MSPMLRAPSPDEKTLPDFETARALLIEGINKIIQAIERRETQSPFTADVYMKFYTTVYDQCFPRRDYKDEKLYELYKQSFENYISSKVLPSFEGKKGVELLQELLKRWKDHKTMSHYLYKMFNYLERIYIPRLELPMLEDASYLIFHDLVYSVINGDIRDAVLSLIDRERDGELIDKALVKEVIHIYVEIGGGSEKYYIKEFEPELMNSTAAYYSKKSHEWIKTTSLDAYIAKVKECLSHEEDRAVEYLQYRSKEKILEIVKHELLIEDSCKSRLVTKWINISA